MTDTTKLISAINFTIYWDKLNFLKVKAHTSYGDFVKYLIRRETCEKINWIIETIKMEILQFMYESVGGKKKSLKNL